jgi:hypothetical protein
MRGGRRSRLGKFYWEKQQTSSDSLHRLKEPTKTLRGALALVTRRKLLHQIRGMKISCKREYARNRLLLSIEIRGSAKFRKRLFCRCGIGIKCSVKSLK